MYQQVDAKGFVAPAQAGARKHAHKKIKYFWIPAYTGMTEKTLLREFYIKLLAFERREARGRPITPAPSAARRSSAAQVIEARSELDQ